LSLLGTKQSQSLRLLRRSSEQRHSIFNFVQVLNVSYLLPVAVCLFQYKMLK
jgi:hypothetical protein